MRRHWWKLLLLVIAVLLFVWGFDRSQSIMWVGRTDLEVEFTVNDTATGGAVPGARVEVQSEGGFYEERDKQEFVLVADAGGTACKVCRNSMCFGTQSGLRVTDTFGVHLPRWRFRVVAEGYEPGKWTYLETEENIQQAHRAGPGKAKLVVPVSLHKRHADEK
jgi:hypothetical protein